MSNSVVKLQTELTGILERAFDRTTRAINDSRSGTYTGAQMYEDATNAFLDGVYGSLLPFLEFLPFEFARKPPFPMAEFELTAAVDVAMSIPLIDPKGVTTVDWEDLASVSNKIPKKHLSVTIVGNDLIVKVKGTGVPAGTKLDVYEGNIIGTSLVPQAAIGRIRLRWYVV